MLGCPCHSSQLPTNSPELTPIPNLDDRASHQKPQNLKEIAQLRFRVAWNLWPLYFFHFSPLDVGMYILGCSTFMLWKQITCYLVSQIPCFCCSAAQSCPALWNPMECSIPGFPVLHYLMEFAETHVHWVDDAIQPSQPLSLSSPPASNFSSTRVFPSESTLRIRWPKYWSFIFSISPSNEYWG